MKEQNKQMNSSAVVINALKPCIPNSATDGLLTFESL
jgi:hypothetical protein